MSSQPSAPDRPDAGGGQAVFEDGLGVRIREESAGEVVERLVVSSELTRFEGALRDRIGRLANFRHVRYPRVRAVERTGSGDDQAVSVVTDAVKGYRLSAILDVAIAHDLVIDVNAALQVARELLPALSVLHDSRNVTHGALGPERIVLTPESRIVIVDHTVGLALERLRFPRSRLWREFRIPMPPSAGLPQFDQRADVAQVAMVVLALVLGRHIGLREFPDGLRTLATETPERLGGGAVRPMTTSLRTWFERALPLESRRPFATALEAQIALENVVTREVAYSPRPGALRSLLHGYEALRDHQGAATDTASREPEATGGPSRRGSRSAGSSARASSSHSSTRRRTGAKGRKAPTPEELEAEEIARLEAELARLMELEQQGEPGPTAEADFAAKVVQFPGSHESSAAPTSAEPPPVKPALDDQAREEPIAEDPIAQPAHIQAPAPPEASFNEEELAALSALLEVESLAVTAPESGAEGEQAVLGKPPTATSPDTEEVVLEVDLDSALAELVSIGDDDPEPDTPVWEVDRATVEMETSVSGIELLASAAEHEPGLAVEPQGEAWALTPPTEEDVARLAGQAQVETIDEEQRLRRDDLTGTLDYEAEPEPVALTFALPYHRRVAAIQTQHPSFSSADAGRLLSLVRRVGDKDAVEIPLRKRPVPRRPAALGSAPEPVAMLASEATPVAAGLAAYPAAGPLVASASLAAVTTRLEPTAPPAMPQVAEAAVAAPAIESHVEAVEVPAAIEPAPAEATVVEVSTDEVEAAVAAPAIESHVEAAEVPAAIEPAPAEATVFGAAGLQASVVEPQVVGFDMEPANAPAAEGAASPVVPMEPALAADDVGRAAVAELTAALGVPASVVEDVSPPVEQEPRPLTAPVAPPPVGGTATDAAQLREDAVSTAKRRRRRRKKAKRLEVEAVAAPTPPTAQPPSQVPVVKPVAPWLRGRDTGPTVRETSPLSSPATPPAPVDAPPPWTRRVREPLPVLPSTERGEAGAPMVAPPVAAIGDALASGDAPVVLPVSGSPDAPPTTPSPVEVVLPAPGPGTAKPTPEFVSSTGTGATGSTDEPAAAQEASGARVLGFPGKRSKFSISWRRTIAASIVIMLIEGGAFAAAYWYVKPREVGYLFVNSTVTGLEVSIDGQERGKTPLSLELPPGRHTIELRGYGTVKTVPVEIAPNVETSQMVAWSRPPEVGRLSLKTIPDGAQVMVDDEPRGVTPLTIDDLAPGTHRVIVQNESGSVEQSVRIAANETAELEVPIYSGWLALFAPVEMRIFEDGRLLGSSLDGRILMPPGRHRLELVNQRLGYRESREVVIQPGRVVAVSVEAPRGTLIVEAPSGTSVSVDGVLKGVTPFGELSVEVGTREILFQHPELGQRRITVTVGVGSPARANMLAPR